ncbi:LamG domain-containing protein [Candidatus Omnitrophota bacterium]
MPDITLVYEEISVVDIIDISRDVGEWVYNNGDIVTDTNGDFVFANGEYPPELFIDVNENTFLVTEVAQIVDLIIEVGVLADTLGVSEDFDILMPILNLQPAEVLSATENFDLLIDQLFSLDYEEIAVVEDVSLYLEVDVFAYDEATAEENVEAIYAFWDVSEYESLSVNESLTLFLGQLNTANQDAVTLLEVLPYLSLDQLIIDVTEPFSVSLTEQVSIIDLIVEVGVTVEEILVSEDFQLAPMYLYVNVSESLSISEYTEVVDLVIDLSVYENVVALDTRQWWAVFNGSNAYLSIPDSDDWYYGTGDVTIEFKFKLDNLPLSGTYNWIWNQRVDGFQAHSFDLRNLGGTLYWRFDIYVDGGGHTNFQRSTTFLPNVEYHIALVRFGNIWRIFQAGTQLGADYVSANEVPNITAPLDIGRWSGGGNYLNGYLKEFRISKGIARWTSDFTPQSTPYVSDAYTVLLLHLDNNVTDSGETGHTVTNNNVTFLGIDSVDVVIPELNLNVYDDISQTEYAEEVVDILQVSVIETLSITEDLSSFLTILNIARYDDILITESAQVIDLVVEVGVVVDFIGIQENIEVLDIILEIWTVFESLTVEENLALYLSELFVPFYVEELSAIEDLIIEALEVPPNAILYFEGISVLEDVLIEPQTKIIVEDSAVATEGLSLYLDALNTFEYEDLSLIEDLGILITYLFVNVYELNGLLITEHTDVLDLVVEVGVVEDFSLVTEDNGIVLDVLNIEVSDEVAIEEWAFVLDITIEMSAYENVTVLDYAGMDMPLYFEAVEQGGGIQLVTVAGW